MEFKNLKELMTYLKDVKVCRAYYAELRWGGNPVCPFCNAEKPYLIRDGKLYRCSADDCKKNFSVIKGTVFENSKIALATWMGAVFILSGHKKGISSCQLARDLGVTQKTAWFILHRIRFMMGEPDPEPLDCIVEVDETYVGGKFANMNRGRRKQFQETGKDNKVAVMGMTQRDGRAKLTVIGANTFKEVVRENIDPSAVVVTDTHLAYVGLANEYAAHLSVNHSQSQYRDGVAFTNTVEGFFSSLKRSIYGIYHSVSPKHLQQYCQETSFRYNERKITDKEKFIKSMKNAVGRRLTYKNLIQKP